MRNITIRQLEVFCETASCAHLGRAAKKLFMTQSAASMALAQFERQVGSQVFTRAGRGIRLNEKGRRLLPLATEVLTAHDRLMESCGEGGAPYGDIRIGASSTVANYCLPRILGEFGKKFPKITVSLHVGNTDEIASSLLKGEADFAIVEGELHDARLARQKWKEDELVILLHPSHRFSSRRQLRLCELTKERWMLREDGSGTLSTLSRMLDKYGLTLENVQEFGHTEAIKNAVEAGLGISCLSSLTVRKELACKSITAIKLSPPLIRHFRIIQRKGAYMSRQAACLLKWLQD